MEKLSSRRLINILMCMLVTGCAQIPTIRNPFDGPPPAYKTQYGPTPAERVEQLRALNDTAASLSEDKQAALCSELAESFDNGRDPIIRRQVIRTLGSFSTPAAVPVLIRANEDPDPRIRVAACEAWGKRQRPESLASLSSLFANDNDSNVRLAACQALGQFQSLDAIQQLANGLDDRNPAIQFASIQSLKSSTGKELGNNVNDWVEYVASLSSPSAGDDRVMLAQPPLDDAKIR